MKRNLRAKETHSFWVTNSTNRNVCLSDLALTIPAGRSMNLLDSKHFHYTLEQLISSAENGSLFKKRSMIMICNNPPQIKVKPGIYLSKEPRYIAPRSAVKIEEKIYEEFLPSENQLASEEKFADEFSGEELLWDPRKK